MRSRIALRASGMTDDAVANGTRIIVGDPGRTYFPKSGLTLLAEYTVPTTRELEDQEVKRSRVWSLDPAG